MAKHASVCERHLLTVENETEHRGLAVTFFSILEKIKNKKIYMKMKKHSEKAVQVPLETNQIKLLILITKKPKDIWTKITNKKERQRGRVEHCLSC